MKKQKTGLLNVGMTIVRFLCLAASLGFLLLDTVVPGLLVKSAAAQKRMPQMPRPAPANLLQPSDFVYLGAFRLPKGTHNGSRFGYGGHNMMFKPDGAKGSLYISGHVYHQLVAEVSIPDPVKSNDPKHFPVAKLLRPFFDVTAGIGKSELSHMRLGGMQLFEGKIYWTVWQYYNVSSTTYPSHGVSNLDASSGHGKWYLDDYIIQKTGGYILEIPEQFANQYLGGKRLASGLNGGIPGLATTSLGPALFAFHAIHTPPASGAHLDALPLILFPYRGDDGKMGAKSDFPGWVACDRWFDASWPVAGDKQALIFVGQKSLGKVYYGEGRDFDCNRSKGYHCTPYEPQMIFFDPNDLADVAEGKKAPWEVLPYQTWSLKELLQPTCKGEVTGVAYDKVNKRLFLLQYGGDRVTNKYEPLPLVYVFAVNNRSN